MTDAVQDATLHMLRFPIDLSALARWAQGREIGWVSRRSQTGREADVRFDEGRALHHLVTEVFGPGAISAFRLMVSPSARRGHLYAYTTQSPEILRETVSSAADPGHLSVIALDKIPAKPMPAEWRVGQWLGFDLKTRPLVRLRHELPHPRDQKPYRPGAELDAFLVEAIRRFPDERPKLTPDGPVSSGMQREGRTHEAVYLDWLAARLAPGAALDPERSRLAHHRRTRTARGGSAPEGPEMIVHGTLQIKDPAAFQQRLASGVGRHKAYGYGMLLLRPPQSAVFAR